MIDLVVFAGLAAFAVTTAVTKTELFRFMREIGRESYLYDSWWKILTTPIRASLCHICFSFWAALPFAAAVIGHADIPAIITPVVYFSTVAVSIIIGVILDSLPGRLEYSSDFPDLSGITLPERTEDDHELTK